jgi:GDP-4-dehydro-6-deoxy-D-mannose reductase
MVNPSPYRVLVTGAEGFVGRHLVSAFVKNLPAGSTIIASGRSPCESANGVIRIQLDVTDEADVTAAIAQFQPSHLFHLAAIAAPQTAKQNPNLAWQVNLFGSLNVAEAVLRKAPDCHFFFVSSAEIYGSSFRSGLPVDEAALLNPINRYASTKAAADLAIGELSAQGLSAVRFRPFNHTGIGQTEDFVVPAFAAQIARIEYGLQEPVIRVGNVDNERDFLDVSDIVRAYCSAVIKRNSLPRDLILNVASGVKRRIGGILEELLSMSTTHITVETDTSRLRPSEITTAIGDAGRAETLLQWAPQIPWHQTLLSVLNNFRGRCGGAPI